MTERIAQPKYVPPNPPSWLKKWQPAYDSDSQIIFRKPDGEPHWTSNKGPQTWMLVCPYDEVLVGGRRGGSKTAGLISWFAMGDLALPVHDPARATYLNDPYYRGLMLRKEYSAMSEFIDECMDFFRLFKVQKKNDPVEFHFNVQKNGQPGAVIYTNHLNNIEAYEKYRGAGLTRIGIEELTQIEHEDAYLRLLGSLRGKKQNRSHNGKTLPKLRTQIMSTTNPDGVGAAWVKDRFVKMIDRRTGETVPWNTPVRNPQTGRTRIFIPMRLEDNPYLRDDKAYMGNLLEQSELKQRQWIHGDWDAAAGKFFTEFRPQGPIGDREATETPWARHVIEPTVLRPYWYRGGGGDWGFQHKSVFHKFCKNEGDNRIHIYDELAVSQVGSYELGILVAQWWLPDLEGLPDKCITLAFSPETFNKTDSNKTRAEQFSEGIKKVLGPYGSFLLKYNDDERAAMKNNPEYARKMFQRRVQGQPKGQMAIVIKQANNSRIDGWQYMVDLMRFRPVLRETEADLRVKLDATFNRLGVEAYEREVAKQQRNSGPEVLPKLVIWKGCKELIRGLTEAIHDEDSRAEDVRKFDAIDGVGGDDGLDCARYSLMSYKEVEAELPKSYWIGEQMEKAQAQHVEAFGTELKDPTRLAMISMTQNAKFENTHQQAAGRFNMPRMGSRRHWNNRQR